MPSAFNCVLLAAVIVAVTELESTRHLKDEVYKEHEMRLNVMKKLEGAMTPHRKVFEDQKALLKADPGQLFTRILDVTVPKYREIELVRTGLDFPMDRGRLGTQVKADIARVKSSFQGGIGPMQEVLLQAESLMPQGMLEELKITRKADLVTRREFLGLETTHLFWKAEEGRR